MSFMREGRDQLLNNYFRTRAKNKQPHMISSYPFWGKNGIKGFWKDFPREYKKQEISQKPSSYIMYSLCTLFYFSPFFHLLYTIETTATEILYDLDSNSDSAITVWLWVIYVLSPSIFLIYKWGAKSAQVLWGLGYIIHARDRMLASTWEVVCWGFNAIIHLRDHMFVST